MKPLHTLMSEQNCKCHYCGVEMTIQCGSRHPQRATVEHLVDKWSSQKHQKIDDDSNRVAACFACNNTRGNIRNKIARKYYQQLIIRSGLAMNAASTHSGKLYKMFGPIPQELFGGE